MRTTLNISTQVIKETEVLYKTSNRSKSIEEALKDAIKFKKLQEFMSLKGKISFDEETIDKLRRAEIDESKNDC